jgi:hypothetical protein
MYFSTMHSFQIVYVNIDIYFSFVNRLAKMRGRILGTNRRVFSSLYLDSHVCFDYTCLYFGDLVEWLGTGLQNRLRRFESGSRLKEGQSSNGLLFCYLELISS